MGCGDECPYVPGKRYIDWDLLDPAGVPVGQVRTIPDDIDRRVSALITRWTRRRESEDTRAGVRVVAAVRGGLAPRWPWHAQLVADATAGQAVDLAVARHSGLLSVRPTEHVVFSAMADTRRAVLAQPAQQLPALHLASRQ